jgi:hypothetical protein
MAGSVVYYLQEKQLRYIFENNVIYLSIVCKNNNIQKIPYIGSETLLTEQILKEIFFYKKILEVVFKVNKSQLSSKK